jgi:hypothetical protein
MANRVNAMVSPSVMGLVYGTLSYGCLVLYPLSMVISFKLYSEATEKNTRVQILIWWYGKIGLFSWGKFHKTLLFKPLWRYAVRKNL